MTHGETTVAMYINGAQDLVAQIFRHSACTDVAALLFRTVPREDDTQPSWWAFAVNLNGADQGFSLDEFLPSGYDASKSDAQILRALLENSFMPEQVLVSTTWHPLAPAPVGTMHIYQIDPSGEEVRYD